MLKAILVDDEPAVLKGLMSLIDWQAMDIEIAACTLNAADALGALRRCGANLMVTDICMPQTDGLTLIAEARQISPDLRIVVISAHEDFEYVRRALSLGVENYLLKPINASELSETLEKTLQNMRRAATSRPGAVAFRTNILDRWVNGAIQDFELMERAEVLNIDLSARRFQCLVATPRDAATINGRLERSVAFLEAFQQALPAGRMADIFLDRYANLTTILRSDGSAVQKEAAQAIHAVAEANGFYCAFGCVTPTPYTLSASYRSAYLMVGMRFLGDAPAVFYDEVFNAYPPCPAMFKYEQALDELSGKAVAGAIDALMAAQGADDAGMHQNLLAMSLTLLGRFDDGKERMNRVPTAVAAGLRRMGQLPAAQAADALAQASRQAIMALSEMRNSLHPSVRKALSAISQRYSENLTIKSMADELSLNPSYFGQLFKAETGQVFGDYLTTVRLRAARNILSGTNRKVNEILSDVGIAQQSYFNRLFRREFGMTPVEYRRASRV